MAVTVTIASTKQQIKRIEQDLARKIDLRQYLKWMQYEQVSPRIFVGNDGGEVLRVTRTKGKMGYRNILNGKDRGDAMDFIRRRCEVEKHHQGVHDLTPSLLAINAAHNFLGQQA